MLKSFDFAMSAKIDARTIAEIIKNAVEGQTGRAVETVTFTISPYSGFRDQGGPVLDSCTVTFAKEKRGVTEISSLV